MATNDKPTVSFYVNYGDLDPVAAQSSLAPVLIAPRYALHRISGGTTSYLGNYSELVGSTVAYPQIAGVSGEVDTDSVSVQLLDPTLNLSGGSAITGGTVQASNTSVLLLPTTATMPVAKGDKLLIGGTQYRIRRAEKTEYGYQFTINGTLTASTSVSVTVIGVDKVQDITLSNTDFDATADGIEISGVDDVVLDGGTYAVYDGKLYAEFRELLSDGAMTLRTNLSSGAKDWAGPADPDNPMGMMYAAATMVTDEPFFYMLSTEDATTEATVEAIEYVAQFEPVYALVPFVNTADTHTAVIATINKYATPTMAQFKHAWLAPVAQYDGDASDYAEALADEAKAINNYHVNLVAADKLNFAGFENVDKAYLCAALASLRASIPPHAPMNAMAIPGFAVVDELKWLDTDYTTMNNGGVFVVYNDVDNNTVVYHQITTLTNNSIAEDDSVVSNGEAIIRQLRTAVRPLCGGQGNATDQLLNAIRTRLITVLTSIEGEYYPDLYGPRILNWEIVRLYIPEGNKRSVRCQLDIDLPEPTDNVRFDFNLF